MEHVLSKTIIITKVTELIAAKYKLKIAVARDNLYNSELINAIDDDSSGLYGESPLYVFSLYEEETKRNNNIK